MTDKINIEEEQRRLVLERFKTLKQDAKISLGDGEEVTVKEVIDHIKEGDEFGKKVIQVQMKMLKVLASGA